MILYLAWYEWNDISVKWIFINVSSTNTRGTEWAAIPVSRNL